MTPQEVNAILEKRVWYDIEPDDLGMYQVLVDGQEQKLTRSAVEELLDTKEANVLFYLDGEYPEYTGRGTFGQNIQISMSPLGKEADFQMEVCFYLDFDLDYIFRIPEEWTERP
jgi:hypothetical protein